MRGFMEAWKYLMESEYSYVAKSVWPCLATGSCTTRRYSTHMPPEIESWLRHNPAMRPLVPSLPCAAGKAARSRLDLGPEE